MKLLVVHQEFETDVFKASVILSNDILLKCVFPSHVSDLLRVSSWADSEGNTFTADKSYGKPPSCTDSVLMSMCHFLSFYSKIDIVRAFVHLHLDFEFAIYNRVVVWGY